MGRSKKTQRKSRKKGETETSSNQYGKTIVKDSATAHLGDVHNHSRKFSGGVHLHNYTMDPFDFLDTGDLSSRSLRARCLSNLVLRKPEDDLSLILIEKGERVPGTCAWLLQEDSYKNWLQNAHPLLWISGLPGQGKSMLALFIIDTLRALVDAQSQSMCTYFCWKAGNGPRNTATYMLRSIIYQLLLRFPHLDKHVLNDFDQQGISLFAECSFTSLWRILGAMAKDPSIDLIYCVLDGLDECELTSQELFLHFLRTSLTESSKESTFASLKILLLSRHLEGRRGQFQLDIQRKCLTISLGSDGTMSDVSLYIDAHLKHLSDRQWSSQRLERMRMELSKRSGNNFLWTAAILGQAKTLPPSYAETSIKKAPSELLNLYDDILSRVKVEFRNLVIIAIIWISNTIRPLTKLELAMALELHRSPETIRLPTTDVIEEVDVLFSQCRNLLIVREKETTVHLLHQTLADHLVSNPPEQNHLDIARVLLRCLCMDEFNDVNVKVERQTYSWYPSNGNVKHTSYGNAKLNPLRRYAYQYWIDHVSQCGNLAEKVDFGGFFASPIYLHFQPLDAHVYQFHLSSLKWFRCRVHCDKEVTMKQTIHMFILACARECYPFVNAFLRADHPGQSERCLQAIRSEALIRSAELGQTRMVKHLLQHQIHVNSVLDYKLYDSRAFPCPPLAEFYGQTALHVSVRIGHYDLSEVLLQANADLTLTDHNGRTALHIAVQYMRIDLIDLLLKFGAKVNATDHELRTPLHYAAQAADERRFDQYGTAASSEDITRLLLSNGAEVTSKDNSGVAPLHLAVRHDELEVAKLCLEAGAAINEKDSQGITVLHDAAERDYPELTAFLLSRNANPLARDSKGRSPLHSASKSASEITALKLLETLHQQDADFFFKDSSGSTPLHVAAEHENLEVLELLVEFGADLLATDDKGRTPLHRAVLSRKFEDHGLKTIKYLVDRDDTALVKLDRNRRTPLALAELKLEGSEELEPLEFSGYTSWGTFMEIGAKPELVCDYLREQTIRRHFEHLTTLDPEVQDIALYGDDHWSERWGAVDMKSY